ncbi:MAG: hypothetical protein FWG78_02025 [Coriobacteriia bacterium]|nr:hypothetical protein [Coriobacteriia bacterium]
MTTELQSISLKRTIVEIVKTPKVLPVFLMLFCIGVIYSSLSEFSRHTETLLWLSAFTFYLTIYQNGYRISYARNIYLSDQKRLPLFSSLINHTRRGFGKLVISLVTLLAAYVPCTILFTVLADFTLVDFDGLIVQEILRTVPPLVAIIPCTFWWAGYASSDRLFTKRTFPSIIASFTRYKQASIVLIGVEILRFMLVEIGNELLSMVSPSATSPLLFSSSGVAIALILLQSLVSTGGILFLGNLSGQYARLAYGQEDSGKPIAEAETVPNVL